jgi:GntP family gluconate:H+ symporter
MDPLVILLIGMFVVVGGVLAFRLHAFVALIAGALVVAALTPTAALQGFADGQVTKGEMHAKAAAKFVNSSIGDRVAIGFGRTCADIGILVAMASIVGKCLLDSGGADRIVRSSMRLLGEAQAPLAFLISGFVLGIPVFFDTVFYLMIPLAKALHVRTGKNYLLYVLSIVAGATMTHSLVPPTPGPLAVAELLRVNMGIMIAGGCIVGAICSAAGYLFATIINRRITIPLRETAGSSIEELQALSSRDERELPPLWLALMPILLPVVLITGHEILAAEWKPYLQDDPAGWHAQVLAVTGTIGHKNISLLMAAAIAVLTVVWKCHTSREQLAKVIEECVLDAGTIILITAAGGAFGGVLQHTGIAGRIADLTPNDQTWLLPIAFAVTAAIRTAQGSATVAMLTAGGVFQALVVSPTTPLAFHPVYLALAIGCGSKVMPWMNDSGFWVITRMSGMREEETLRTQTPMLVIMGCVGVLVTMLGAWLFPLV